MVSVSGCGAVWYWPLIEKHIQPCPARGFQALHFNFSRSWNERAWFKATIFAAIPFMIQPLNTYTVEIKKKWWRFRSFLSRLNGNKTLSHAQKNGNWMGWSVVTETTILLHKQARRSTVLAKRLHLEATWAWLIDSFDPRTHSKSKSGSSTLSQQTLDNHSSIILLGERTCWLLIFYISVNHAKLLIAWACMQNGNGTVNGHAI